MFDSGFRIQKNYLGGHAKKINIRQVFKVLTCFAVIVMVFITSIIPVYADNQCLKLGDHYVDDYYDGAYHIVKYHFLRQTLVGYSTPEIPWTYTVPDNVNPGTRMQVTQFLLGSYVSGGQFLDETYSDYIDVRDLKPRASLKVSYTYYAAFDLRYHAEASGDVSLPIATKFSLSMYDKDGKYIGLHAPSVYGSVAILENPHTTDDYTYNDSFTCEYEWELPENCAYIIPLVLHNLTFPDNESPIYVEKISFSSGFFEIKTCVDTILENSMTYDVIKDKLGELNDKADQTNQELGDLNDKADEIINGNLDQWDAAQDADQELQDIQSDLDSIMSELDEYEEFDLSVMDAIKDFLEADGWKDMAVVLDPFLNWRPMLTIMLVVLSLVNLSVILFGR